MSKGMLKNSIVVFYIDGQFVNIVKFYYVYSILGGLGLVNLLVVSIVYVYIGILFV